MRVKRIFCVYQTMELLYANLHAMLYIALVRFILLNVMEIAVISCNFLKIANIYVLVLCGMRFIIFMKYKVKNGFIYPTS